MSAADHVAHLVSGFLVFGLCAAAGWFVAEWHGTLVGTAAAQCVMHLGECIRDSSKRGGR